ncbi:unnamed protein product, partial [Meganyctiphanes norvegica]
MVTEEPKTGWDLQIYINYLTPVSFNSATIVLKNIHSFRRSLNNNIFYKTQPREASRIGGVMKMYINHLTITFFDPTFIWRGGKPTFLNTSSLNLVKTRVLCQLVFHKFSNKMMMQELYTKVSLDLFFFQLKPLKLEHDFFLTKILNHVILMLFLLGLAKCADTYIGIPGRIKGISGGETKRLAFACEVLSNPQLMFCDEPTSGLDSFMAMNVVSVLKTMASRGKSIITTIHQPSSEVFAMFNQVLLMSEGSVAFMGKSEDALKLFESLNTPCPTNFNPADFFIMKLAIRAENEEECKNFCKMVCDKFAETEEYKAIIGNIKAPVINNVAEMTGAVKYKASWTTQFCAVYKRSLLDIIRNPLTLKIRIIDALVMSIITGLIYLGQDINQDGIMNINGAIFLIIINMSFGNIISVVETFCGQTVVFLREHFNGAYRTDVYYISKNLAQLPVSTIIPIIYTVIVYFMVGFNPETKVVIITIILVVLLVNTAVSYGYMISCLVASPSTASVITAPLIVPMLIFGGFFLKSTTVPLYFSWLKYLSWFSHSNEALMINQWSSVEEIQCSSNTTCIGNGKEVLQYLGYEEDNFWYAIGNLVILLVGYRLLGFLALLHRTYNRR